MKKSLMATLVAASMLSPLAFASEPVELSTAQMDTVTAGQDLTILHDLNIFIAPVNQVAVAVAVGDYAFAAAGNTNYQDVHQHNH